MSNLLEVCVDSLESALAAQRGGASRLELCADLIVGGTTPGINLYKMVRRETSIPIRILIRPRFGDFCYTDAEFALMLEDINMFRLNGADGVVIGMLRPDGDLDTERMEKLIEAAGDMGVTLHRAFDVCRDPMQTMEKARSIGIDTILTSGQAASCMEGKELLKELVSHEDEKLRIMIGGGVNAGAIKELKPYTGASIFHMSGKTEYESPMIYRNNRVNMGLSSISEFTRYKADEEKIRAAAAVLDLI